MNNWHERKQSENQLRLHMLESNTQSYRTLCLAWKHRLERAGWVPFRAVNDYAGNCVYCGEAGRCWGWHIYDGRMDAVATTQPDAL